MKASLWSILCRGRARRRSTLTAWMNNSITTTATAADDDNGLLLLLLLLLALAFIICVVVVVDRTNETIRIGVCVWSTLTLILTSTIRVACR